MLLVFIPNPIISIEVEETPSWEKFYYAVVYGTYSHGIGLLMNYGRANASRPSQFITFFIIAKLANLPDVDVIIGLRTSLRGFSRSYVFPVSPRWD